ncbi:alpha-amylase family glycosyl hydrolase [Halobacillus campisalis]|uniref:Alpha-amylase family glycosyl hydrolase n=1 Tax=Halobacillus campisalis TaxID=435909 RepID=A0ABW2K4V3_9BACI|nr:alpha-amylase family glycosyl hydrolase [Halobacillus campisalis]
MRKLTMVLMFIPFLLFYAFETEAVEKEERRWQDESMYYIMVDRFMNGNTENDYEVDKDNPEAYHGGDLQGVIDQLDYIEEMGFTSIMLSPIMKNTEEGYHGYWIDDFMQVEGHFGTIEDAQRLVEEAHNRDLKVIFEFVVSHTGNEHPWLEESGQEDKYFDSEAMEENDVASVENTWLSNLPRLNTDHPEVQSQLTEAAQFWKEETGVDGFRLSSINQVSKEFLSIFNESLKLLDDDFILIGDVNVEDPDDIEAYESAGIDSFVNDPFYEAASGSFNHTDASLDSLFKVWQSSLQNFENPELLGHYLDDPSTKRFTRVAVEEGGNPVTRWKLALTHMFTSPGYPILTYGSEVPLDGGEPPDNLKMMNFKGGDEELKQHIEKLNSMREEFPVLRRGTYEELFNSDGLAVIKRVYKEETMVIAMNNSPRTQAVDLTELPDDQQMRGLLEDGVVRQNGEGVYKLGMERETADVFVVEEDKGLNWLFIGFVGGVLLLFVTAVIVISLKNKE